MDTVCLRYEEIRPTMGQLHEILLSIGIPPNIHGYSYIVYSLELIMEDPQAMYSVTKGLYIDVAKKFNTKPTSVERSIRFAIGSAWKYGNQEFIHSIFKSCIRPSKSAPSNSVFLSRLYYYIMNMENNK